MGKPAPGADGVIRFVFTSRLTVPLVGGTIYEARVSATTAQTGSGTLSYVITPNLGAARSVTLTVAGRQVTVAQSAAVVPAPSNVHIVGASEQ